MKKINFPDIYKKIEQHYFVLFLIMTVILCSLSLVIFYKYYYLVKKETFSLQREEVYFREKEYKNIEKELQEREKSFSDIDKKIIENPFIGLTE